MVDKQTARLWAQVRAQVKRIDAEHAAKQGLQEMVAFAERYNELMRTQPMVVHALMAHARRLAAARSPVQPRFAPHNRNDMAETARVVCLGWNNPKAVNRWVYERNIFWAAKLAVCLGWNNPKAVKQAQLSKATVVSLEVTPERAAQNFRPLN